jgi:phosphoglycerol transferase MdoB-like AlkP superfamily enzyme
MKQRLFFWCKLFLFWVALFFILRVAFVLTYFNLARQLSFSDYVGLLIHGLHIDLSATAYLMLLPSLVLSLFFVEGRFLWILSSILIRIFLFFVLFLSVTDLFLFQHWGFRLDTTPLLYITTPTEAFASLSTLGLILAGICVLIVIALTYYLPLLFKRQFSVLPKMKWWALPVFLLLTASLILPIRGGVGIAPMNPGMVFFSNTPFANQAALNVFWNVGYSLKSSEMLNNPFVAFNDSTAQSLVKDDWTTSSTPKSIFKVKKPNVIIVILESFTGKLVGSIGGEKGITPNLDSIAQHGVLFSNFYSTSDRSDKGIVAVLSGFPAQPNTSIIKYPNKTAHLPHLASIFNKNGYTSSFYYGGDINFASMRSYFNQAGYNKLITKDDYNSDIQNGKWGVHDHVVFDRILTDLDKSTQPFFITYFTLSSHEPFTVPMSTVIKGNSEADLFRNSVYYTDKSLGEFVRKASTKKWWNNTVVIFVADHGSRHPFDDANYVARRFHIPMIWTGGALAVSDTVVKTFGSQPDIPATLLQQLGFDFSNFHFGKNILDPLASSSAFYVFNTGVGCVEPNGQVVYDLKGKLILDKKGNNTDIELNKSKAYVQLVYDKMLHMK